MKTKNVTLSLVFLAVLIFSSCEKDYFLPEVTGNGPLVEETIDLPAIKGIDLGIQAKVVIRQGAHQEIRVTGQENIIHHLRHQVRGGIWDIRLTEGTHIYRQLTLDITLPEVTDLGISGSGDITVMDFVQNPSLDIEIPGSGTIRLNSMAGTEHLDVSISGSGDVIHNKDFTNLISSEVRISGTGKYKGYPVHVKNSRVEIPGTGDCYVNVTEMLDVRISGNGYVYYKGDPEISVEIRGNGKLIHE